MPIVTKSLGEGTQSVLLTIAIFERFASRPGSIGISELAREIGTSKSRIFRHLQTLVANKYVALHGEGEYVIGGRLMELCRAIGDRYDLVGVAAQIMTDLREHLGHSVIISRVDTIGVRVLKTIPGRSPIEVGIRPGTVLPFETSAQGKVALAFIASASQTPKSAIGDAYNALSAGQKAELEVIRQRGWATAQMRQGLTGMAAPVFDGSGDLVATLGLLDTASDMGDDLERTKSAPLVDAARRLSGKLQDSGFRVP